MQIETGYENRRPRIEIVPLVDVVFLLLVFFIYAMVSMTVYRGLRVNLPAADGHREQMDALVISIDEDGTLRLEGRAVSMEKAVAETATRASQSSGPVLVSGDRTADLGVAIELLDALRRANVQSVSFQVKEGE